MSTTQWLSVAQVAEKLGVKPDTVYTWIQKRGLPGHRLGRNWRFDPVEVEDWVRSGEAAAPSVATASTKAKSTRKSGRKAKR